MDTYTDILSNTVHFDPAPSGPSPLLLPREIVSAPRPPDRPRMDRQIIFLPDHRPPADYIPACAVCGGAGQPLHGRADAARLTAIAVHLQASESDGGCADYDEPQVVPDGLSAGVAAATPVPCESPPPPPASGNGPDAACHEPAGGARGANSGCPASCRGLEKTPDEYGSGGGGGEEAVNPVWFAGVNPLPSSPNSRGGDDVADDGGRAVPLIVVAADGRAEVGEEAAELLGRLRGPVAVVAVVGPYRSGKSFLLNRVLLGRAGPGGFPVGATVEACTKGLWMWSKALPAVGLDGSHVDVVLVDTEGEPARPAADPATITHCSPLPPPRPARRAANVRRWALTAPAHPALTPRLSPAECLCGIRPGLT